MPSRPPPPPPTSQHQDFHRHALDILLTKLTGYGNQISSDHEAALSGLCELAGLTLRGQSQRRVRFALPCGMGKTTAVRSIIQAAHELKLSTRIVVASSKVEELCQLMEQLIRDGVPADAIGLRHSYLHNERKAKAGHPNYASQPSRNHDAQFLLVTHAHVQSGEERRWMTDSDLVLFDESLVVGDPICLPLSNGSPDSVLGEVGALESLADKTPPLRPAALAARQLLDRINASANAQSAAPIGIVRAQAVDVESIRCARAVLADWPNHYRWVRQLFDWAEAATELRVHGNEGGQTLLTYRLSVPDCLQRVIVLDGSDPIRQLIHHDKRMVLAEDVLPSLAHFRDAGGLASIKRHDRIRVHHVCEGGGRSTLEKELASASPRYIERLVDLVKRKPDESFVVFTHKAKDRSNDIPKQLARAMEAAGVDACSSVATGLPDIPSVPRLTITTWGRETGTNEFSACDNVVMLGVLIKPEEAVAGTYLGQVDDLRNPRMGELARQLVRSESHHSIYQAANRGRMRRVQVIDGVTQAQPMNVYILHLDADLEDRLRVVLPGCPPWQPWREEGESFTTHDVAMMIGRELDNLELADLHRISLQALRSRLDTSIMKWTFNRAWKKAVADRKTLWLTDGGSLVRAFPVAA